MIIAGQPDATRPGGVPAQFTTEPRIPNGTPQRKPGPLAVARYLYINNSRTSRKLNTAAIGVRPTFLVNVLAGLLAYCHQPKKPSLQVTPEALALAGRQ